MGRSIRFPFSESNQIRWEIVLGIRSRCKSSILVRSLEIGGEKLLPRRKLGALLGFLYEAICFQCVMGEGRGQRLSCGRELFAPPLFKKPTALGWFFWERIREVLMLQKRNKIIELISSTTAMLQKLGTTKSGHFEAVPGSGVGSPWSFSPI